MSWEQIKIFDQRHSLLNVFANLQERALSIKKLQNFDECGHTQVYSSKAIDQI